MVWLCFLPLQLVERRQSENVDTPALLSHMSDKSSDVHTFMREQGTAGAHCMTSVVVSALCSLTKRYLVMEGAAAGGWGLVLGIACI